MAPAGGSPRVAVLTKAPRAGAVKTRLVPMLGPEGAAALHARLVLRALELANSVTPYATQLYCAPSTRDAFFDTCRRRYRVDLHDQGTGDLGDRMARAFDGALAQGGPVLLIGTDCPALTPARLRAAGKALQSGQDAVFVPTEDGGYALIGLARSDPRLFVGVPWSSNMVMETTRERARQLGWSWQELETTWDIDRPEDYERLISEGWLQTLPE